MCITNVNFTKYALRVTAVLFLLGHAFAQNCPGLETLVDSHGVAGTVRNKDASVGTPVELISGCQYNVFIPEDTEVYLVLPRPTSTSRLVYEFNWEGEMKQPMTLFSWSGQCCMSSHPHINIDTVAIYADWAIRPELWKDVVIFPFAEDGKDKYHCTAACITYRETSNTGDLYITLSTWLSYASVEGTFSFSFEEPRPYIKPEQLAVIQELYLTTCWPTQQEMPVGWSWRAYQESTATDAQQKPYCDWLDKGCGTQEGCSGWTGYTTNSCSDLDNIFCDVDGNVIWLDVFESGLRGSLPDSLSQLTMLERVDLSTNQISGTLPLSVLSLPQLETFSVMRNKFVGTVPCLPSGAKLQDVDLSSNLLTGTIPACIGDNPNLLQLDLASNLLTGSIPKEMGKLSSLVVLSLSQNMIVGSFPESMASMTDLAYLMCSRTYMSGSLSPMITTELTSLVELDISHSSFEGSLPPLGDRMSSLRVVQVSNNNFNGSVVSWFEHMEQSLLAGSSTFAEGASFYLGGNTFSGMLPDVIYNFMHDVKYSVDHVNLGGNHFRCDKETGSWPVWALNVGSGRTDSDHDLGRCTQVARVNKINPVAMNEGGMITVNGQDFLPSQESTCKFIFPNQMTKVVRSAFLSSTQIFCEVPAGAISAGWARNGDDVEVSVANFGEDYYSSFTVKNYNPGYFQLVCLPTFAGDKCQFSRAADCSGRGNPKDDGTCICDEDYSGSKCHKKKQDGLPTWVIVVIVLVVCLALALGVFITILIVRERKGEPVFSQLTNPLLSAVEADVPRVPPSGFLQTLSSMTSNSLPVSSPAGGGASQMSVEVKPKAAYHSSRDIAMSRADENMAHDGYEA